MLHLPLERRVVELRGVQRQRDLLQDAEVVECGLERSRRERLDVYQTMHVLTEDVAAETLQVRESKDAQPDAVDRVRREGERAAGREVGAVDGP